MAYGTIATDNLTSSTGGVISPNITSLRNRIINGAMVIDQRNSGASVTNINGSVYTVDRFVAVGSQASKYTIQQNAGSVTPPAGFTNYLGVTSSSAYTVGSSENFTIRQYIEGFNWCDLGWGTANAKTVTLSFWVYSSLTGTFGGSLTNYSGSYSYPFTYTISSANTWTQIAITIAGPTSGTWVGASNNGALQLNFGLGVGSTYSGTAGSWSGSNYLGATGATSVVSTSGATFYITGVQLEAGTQATSFDYRQYGTELDLCLRYFQNAPSAMINGITSSSGIIMYYPKVPFRTTPTVSLYSTSPYVENVPYYLVGSLTSATLSTTHLSPNGGDILISGTWSPAMSYGAVWLLGLLNGTGQYGSQMFLSAEL